MRRVAAKRRRAEAAGVEFGDQEGEGELVKGEDGLTPKQAAFVEAFTVGINAGIGTKAAIAAGYSEKSAATIGSLVQKLPHVAAAIDASLREAIGSDLTARSVQLLRTVLDDVTAPLKLRTEVALKLVEGSGLVDRTKASKANETGLGGAKPLAEMSREELEAVVKAGAAVLKAAATLPGPGQAIEGTISGPNVLDGVPTSGDIEA